ADLSAKADGETAPVLAAKRGDSEAARVLGVPEEERKRLGVAPAPRGSGSERSIAAAVGPALALLEKQSYNFIRIGGCNSCHSQDLPSVAAALARSRGIRAPAEIPQLPASMMPPPERLIDLNVVAVIGVAWEVCDLGMNGGPANAYTDAAVRAIRMTQTLEGDWNANES